MEDDGLEDVPGTQPTKTYEDGIIDTASVISVICAALLFWYIFYVVPKFSDIFKSLRVDIPLPTRLLLALATSPGLNLVCLGGGLVIVELLRRKRSAKVALCLMIILVLSLPAAWSALNLPIWKIQDALRKK
jgi:hypothetical protein